MLKQFGNCWYKVERATATADRRSISVGCIARPVSEGPLLFLPSNDPHLLFHSARRLDASEAVQLDTEKEVLELIHGYASAQQAEEEARWMAGGVQEASWRGILANAGWRDTNRPKARQALIALRDALVDQFGEVVHYWLLDSAQDCATEKLIGYCGLEFKETMIIFPRSLGGAVCQMPSASWREHFPRKGQPSKNVRQIIALPRQPADRLASTQRLIKRWKRSAAAEQALEKARCIKVRWEILPPGQAPSLLAAAHRDPKKKGEKQEATIVERLTFLNSLQPLFWMEGEILSGSGRMYWVAVFDQAAVAECPTIDNAAFIKKVKPGEDPVSAIETTFRGRDKKEAIAQGAFPLRHTACFEKNLRKELGIAN